MMKKTERHLPFVCVVVQLLALLCSGEDDSTSSRSSIIFNTVSRVYYTFDIYSLPIQQQPLSPNQELRLTDGHSVNFNGHFISNTSAIQLPTSSSPLQLVYITERNGSPTIYYDAVYTSTTTTRRSALESVNTDRLQLPLLPKNFPQLSMQDRPNLTPDGQFLIYVSTHQDPGIPRASWAAVYSTHLQSGLTQRLTPNGVTDFSPSLSPSGLWTAVASYGPNGWAGQMEDFTSDIYVFLTRDGTQRVKIVEHGGWPAWGDDRTIYFHRQSHDHWWSIYSATFPSNAPISPDSVIIERVTPPGLHVFTPATSLSNNNFIAVATSRPDSEFRHIELFDLVNNEFIELTRLVSPRSHHYNPFISPDFSMVGYHKCRGEPNAHSNDSPQLMFENVQSPDHDLSLLRFIGEFPVFSPAGDRIAYTGAPGVYVVNRDGSKLRKISEAMAFSTAWDPVRPGVIYTAMGQSFAAARSQVDIVSINVDVDDEETVVKRLTVDGNNNAFPSVSPDGKWMVFRSGRSGYNNLYIMDAVDGETKELRRLTEGAWNDTMCVWSPDGEWIVFSSNRHGVGIWNFDLYLIHPNGTGLRKLFHSGSGGRSNHPCFSPDGKSVAFGSDYAGISAEPISYPDIVLPYGEVFTIKLDGSGLKRLTHNSYEDGTPAWTHNYIHPMNVQNPNHGRYCSFQDYQFPNYITNNTIALPLSKDHFQCAL